MRVSGSILQDPVGLKSCVITYPRQEDALDLKPRTSDLKGN